MSEDPIKLALNIPVVKQNLLMQISGFVVLAFFIASSSLKAANCIDVFASATQTSSPDLILPTFLTSSSNSDQSGSSLSLAAGEYKDVDVNQNGSVTFTTTDGEYRLNKLQLSKNATATFAPGDYYIDQLQLEQGASIVVSGTGTVRIYSNDISTDKNVEIAIGTPYLILIGYGDISFGQGTDFEGVIYSTDKVQTERNSRITGAVHADEVEYGNNNNITYDTDPINNADFNGMCDGTTVFIDHILLTYSNPALTCMDETINIRACTDASCTSVVTTDVSVTLSTSGDISTWSSNPVTIPANSSSGIDVSLTHRSAETITLSASSAPAASNALVCSPVGCNLTFSEAGFILTLPNHNSCSSVTQLNIQAVRLSDTGTSCAPAYVGNQSVDFSFAYNNPVTGSVVPILASTNMAAVTVIQNRTINFDATASAALDFEYRDAGQLTVTVADAASAGLSSASVTSIVTPPKLNILTSNANNACAGPDYGNCTVFKVAGITGNAASQFNLIVEGACADDTLTANFELSSIPLTSNLVAPSGGANATLGDSSVDITTGGTVTVSQTISEVGAFTITATPPNYLGQPIPAATSSTIGRFIPDRLIVSDNSPLVTDATCDFTYQDQNIDFAAGLYPELTVRAVNSAGVTTLNYGGEGVPNNDFWKLDSTLLSSRTYANLVVAYPGTLTSTLGAITTADEADYDGSNTFSFINDQLNYGKSAATPVTTNDAAFDASISLNLGSVLLTDSDGVFYDSDDNGSADAFTSTTITGTNVRWGRWNISNAFGSELQPLILMAEAQYFNGTNFVINTTDTCSTTVTPVLSNYAGNLSLGETGLTQGTMTAGLIPLTLSAPGTGNDGSLLITLTTPDWLTYDFNADGTAENAAATATFGIFEGREPIILQRQNY